MDGVSAGGAGARGMPVAGSGAGWAPHCESRRYSRLQRSARRAGGAAAAHAPPLLLEGAALLTAARGVELDAVLVGSVQHVLIRANLAGFAAAGRVRHKGDLWEGPGAGGG